LIFSVATTLAIDRNIETDLRRGRLDSGQSHIADAPPALRAMFQSLLHAALMKFG
jgi:hypothetical protein